MAQPTTNLDMHKLSKKKSIWPLTVALFLLLVLISVVSIVPLYWMFRSSLMSNAEIFVFPPRIFPSTWRWQNYAKTFQNFNAVLYLKNTMLLLVPCVIGTVLTSAMAGYALGRVNFPGRKLWFVLVIGSMILPGHVLMIPTYLTYSTLKLTNSYWPFYLGAWFGGGASNIFLMRQFMIGLPKEYDEAAYIDGASRIQIFFRILVPLCKPIMITVGIFAFMNYWNDFQAPLIYLRDDKKFPLALGLMTLKGAYSSKWNYIMCGSLVMVVPAIILFAVGQKYFLNGIVMTGVKG